MKAVKYISHSLHYVFLAVAMLAVLGLVSFSGSAVRPILAAEHISYYFMMSHFVAALVLSVVLFEVDSWSEHFAHDKF